MTAQTRLAQNDNPSLISGKALVAVVVWGASFVVTKVALQTFTPFGLVAIRLVSGAAVLVVVARIGGRGVWPARADRGVCVLLGVILGGHLLIQAYGLVYTTAINTGWIIGFIPVTIALSAQLLGRQRLSGWGWLGVSVSTAGVLVVTMTRLPNFEQARFGDGLQLLSCITWTAYSLIGGRSVASSGAFRVTTYAMVVAAAVCLPPAVGVGLTHAPLTVGAVVSAAYLGLICSALALLLWYQALDEHGPTRAGAILYFEPFVTLLVAVAVLSEPVSVRSILGGVCVVGGVWLVSCGVRRAGGATAACDQSPESPTQA